MASRSGAWRLSATLEPQAAPQRGKLRLPVFKGRGGLACGVDRLSNKAMHLAFTGLGVPYWRPEARGAISRLDREWAGNPRAFAAASRP